MSDMQMIIWLLPIIFIFHDFEEIIMMKPWINKNNEYIKTRFPRLSKRLLAHFDNINTSAFALGVAEEFIIISIITVITYMNQWYYLWEGIFISFTLHLIIHCIQALILRRYVPVIITSIISLPICIMIILVTIENFHTGPLLFYVLISLIAMIINLGLVHKMMDLFTKFLLKYEKGSM